MAEKRAVVSIFCGLLVLSLLLSGCEKLSEIKFLSKIVPKKEVLSVKGTIIAKVNDMPITLELLEQEIDNYNQLVNIPEARLTTKEQKLAYLNEELVRRYLFYQEAKARGLDKKAETQELLRNLEINLLANQLLQSEIENTLVTSSEIEDFYNLYKEQFRQEEERRIREIVVGTETEAKEILIELLKGADFATLAQERSRAESATRGGNLGVLKKGQRGNDFLRFDEVAFSPSLTSGQISNIFRDKGGYYIIKVEEIKGGQTRGLSEVWDEIKTNVLFLKQQQKYQELTNRLLKDALVVVYEEKIN
ncbi:MAG: peptidyl-prolyl cis-trans isomerase [Candidatus Omnitrophota bacterium]|jgi:peptidyl-prolyl cis-trans isomerase C